MLITPHILNIEENLKIKIRKIYIFLMFSLSMRYRFRLLFFLLAISYLTFAQGVISEGGNMTLIDLSISQPTQYWGGIVGVLNGSPILDLNNFVSIQNVSNASIFYNEPNGSYAAFYNVSMIITRLPFKPNISEIFSPDPSDFNETGMFSNFSAFSGMTNYSIYSDSPYNTFAPFLNTTCYIYQIPFNCSYIILKNNTIMGVLKFDNGTHEEPLFVNVIENLLGYNGSYFHFEYIVPILEKYYFYIYGQKECNITVWIDDVQTTTFPQTGVPYKVVAQARDENGNILENVTMYAVESNGRNIFYPIIEAANKFFGKGSTKTNASGMATFVLTPSRYNIPDNYNYEAYLEVSDGSFYCRKNLSIANYASLTPIYRTSLVNNDYASQVKSSTQNMNSLAKTASIWVTNKKIREKNITVYTNGTVEHNPSVLLKAGAPNLINITVKDNTTGDVVNATLDFSENNGLIIFVPLQPDKELYTNEKTSYSNQTIVLIPTEYNNNANITLLIYYNDSAIANIVFNVDSTLEPPVAAESDMNDTLYGALSSSLQNINMVLANIGKSLSTV